ncbi:unnamed protein product [Ectocarpus sp. 12 AP-2014]
MVIWSWCRHVDGYGCVRRRRRLEGIDRRMDENHGTGYVNMYEVTGRCQGGEPWTAFVFHLEPTALQGD